MRRAADVRRCPAEAPRRGNEMTKWRNDGDPSSGFPSGFGGALDLELGSGSLGSATSSVYGTPSPRPFHQRGEFPAPSPPPLRMKIATWNVNGVRARQEQVREWVGWEQPDVICLQEI